MSTKEIHQAISDPRVPLFGVRRQYGQVLARLKGVVEADADYDQAMVGVRFDSERVSDDDIHTQIRASGFEPVGVDAPS